MSTEQELSAFPTSAFNYSGDMIHQEGMTLRQYYIGQAIAGLCANPNVVDSSIPINSIASQIKDLACVVADNFEE